MEPGTETTEMLSLDLISMMPWRPAPPSARCRVILKRQGEHILHWDLDTCGKAVVDTIGNDQIAGSRRARVAGDKLNEIAPVRCVQRRKTEWQ